MREALQWWLTVLNGNLDITVTDYTTAAQHISDSDGSLHPQSDARQCRGGHGARFLGHMFAGTFSETNAPHCIAFMELCSPVRIVEIFGPFMQDSTCFPILDSAAMFYAINAGASATLHVNELLKRLSVAARKHNVTVVAAWRTREHDWHSDALANGTHPHQHEALSLTNNTSIAS